MTQHNGRLARTRMLPVFGLAFITIHLFLFHVLRHVGMSYSVSGAVAAGVVLVMLAKHLGLLAVLLRPLYNRFRRPSAH